MSQGKSINNYQAYFVSDVHMTSETDSIGEKFIAFLKSLKGGSNATHLFLLGDIFDLWIAHHQYFQEKFPKVIAELSRLVGEGVEVHYFEGNHDLYLHKFWQDEIGLKVHAGPIEYSLESAEGSRKLYLAHGDQVDPEDKGYRFLRWFLRTPLMKIVGHHLPGRAVAKIGETASAKSRRYTSEVKTISGDRARKVLRQFVEEKANTVDADLFVTGHLHIFDDYEFKCGERCVRSINLGTWLEEPRYLVLEGARRIFATQGFSQL